MSTNVWRRRSPDDQSETGPGTGTEWDKVGPIVGIDFGTSNSCISIWNPLKRRAKVIRNASGKKLTPSTVQFNSNNFTSCQVGCSLMDLKTPVISGVKSKLGMLHDSSQVAKPNIITAVNANGDSKEISPIEICSIILRELIHNAELYLHRNKQAFLRTDEDTDKSEASLVIKAAVMGIPAHFNEARKQALRAAAHEAGIDKVTFLVESSAAALGYGLFGAGRKVVLVFDMGGGTTDASVIAIDEGEYRVLAVDGNNVCGGQDFDRVLLQLLNAKLSTALGIVNATAIEIFRKTIEEKLPTLSNALLLLSKQCKESLSDEPTQQISVPISVIEKYATEFRIVLEKINAKAEMKHLQVKYEKEVVVNISRSEFEAIAQPIVDSAVAVAQRAITTYFESLKSSIEVTSTAAAPVMDIEEVVLVGGSSRVPLVRQCLRQMLSNKLHLSRYALAGSNQEFCCSLDPDEAVAKGLAIRGAVLMGHDVPQLKDILMLDMLSSSIGLISWADVGINGSSATDAQLLDSLQNYSKHLVIAEKDENLYLQMRQLSVSSNPTANVRSSSANTYRKALCDDRYIRYFEPILHRCDRIPAKGRKVFKTESSSQKFVSLDIFEEIEIDLIEDMPATEAKYRYQLVGTYDLPIPKRQKKALAESSHESVEKLTCQNMSIFGRIVRAVNDYFELDSYWDNEDEGRQNQVAIELSLNEDGEIGFTVELIEEDNDTVKEMHVHSPSQNGSQSAGVRNASTPTKSDDYTIILLICWLLLFAIVYVFARATFIETKYSDAIAATE